MASSIENGAAALCSVIMAASGEISGNISGVA